MSLTENSYPEIIIECANSHDGNSKKLISLVNTIANFDYPNKSIKLQVFSPDTLALQDYPYYKIYQEISFKPLFWNQIIEESKEKIGKVWLDIFDLFGIEILKNNIDFIDGIKLQASVLQNYEVKAGLKKINLCNLRLLINISGYDLNDISNFVSEFKLLNFKEIILQLGFQSYPTEISSTALQKIKVIQSCFNNRICIAEHSDANESYSIDLPIYALAYGCKLIEKHICLDRKNTIYDYFSSLEPHEFILLFKKINNWLHASTGPFINEAEKTYLANSIQIPITKRNIESKKFINNKDFLFRRTSQLGLSLNEIKKIQEKKMIIKTVVPIGKTITEDMFKKAKIGVVVGCRLKSSRLKRKALLPIGGQPSIEMCLENCLKIPCQNIVVLATSNLSEDEELKKFTLNDKVQFFQGDPNDVLSRYVAAAEKYDLDVIIRVTGDCPFISPEIAEILLNSHFEAGADFTMTLDAAIGTSCEIINVQALQTVLFHLGSAPYSEYMTWYFKNNPEIFKLNYVNLPDKLVREYRLTLDYVQDLEMFEALCRVIKEKKLPRTIESIFKILDENPDLVSLNASIQPKYKADEALIRELDLNTKISVTS
ncbi:putative glycosyltransferase [Legionella busanensis]|uniref:Putative glycosyltransferase n=1 Tax=Legionella busanensis TaxID=190655 RepID=A0A378JJB3_9GAMM|nr:N-acetylneuraminate synthase family protein [Legionella busanensis]STX51396.1 putative glycosyltransferase [Legionella busanensis]